MRTFTVYLAHLLYVNGMKNSAQTAKAERFRALHAGPKILILPNAWDAASAALVEAAGFPAIATSSAGCANAMGFADGNCAPRAEMLAAVARIAAAVELPVSADLEGGYGAGAENAAQLARELLGAGAIGLNLEDGTGNPAKPFKDLPQSLDEIRAIREAGKSAGVHILINARTDTFWEGRGSPEENFAEAVRRCRAFHAAGADCTFVPGLENAELIARMVRETQAPLNVLIWPGMPPISDLERLGVRRLSFGGRPSRAAYGYFRELLAAVVQNGETSRFASPAISYDEMNRLFASRRKT